MQQISFSRFDHMRLSLYTFITKRIERSIPLFLLLPMLCFSFLTRLDNIYQYHGDENIWIAVGNQAFQMYFVEGDRSNAFWSDDFSNWGAYHPQVGKYLIGAGTYFAGYTDIPVIWYDFSRSHPDNILTKNVLDKDIVKAARQPIALLGLLCCVLTYLIVTKVTNRWYGYLASVILVGSGLMLRFSQRAMIDIPALFFSLLALLLTISVLSSLRSDYSRRAHLWSIALGLSLGLAISSKLNALLMIVVIVSCIMLESIYALLEKKSILLHTRCLGNVLIYAGFVFLISNPFLYTDPIGGIAHMFSLNQALTDQTMPDRTTTLAAKSSALFVQTLRFSPLNQLGLPGDRYLLLLGMVRLVVGAVQQPKKFWQSYLGVLSVWALVLVVGITLWLPSNYDRYFLPLHPIKAFIEAYGVLWLVQAVWSRLARSSKVVANDQAHSVAR